MSNPHNNLTVPGVNYEDDYHDDQPPAYSLLPEGGDKVLDANHAPISSNFNNPPASPSYRRPPPAIPSPRPSSTSPQPPPRPNSRTPPPPHPPRPNSRTPPPRRRPPPQSQYTSQAPPPPPPAPYGQPYNSNQYGPPNNLPFTYPPGYWCPKCNNTGRKLKNGKTCQTCYELFAPRPPVVQTGPGFLVPPVVAPMAPVRPVRPRVVRPGDPRLGGVLCGRCRGSGRVTMLLMSELCPVCRGTGRILTPGAGPGPGFRR